MKQVFKRGFTLIEILVVVAIITILAAILGSVFITMSRRAENEGAANQIKMILHACEQFKGDFGIYPVIDPKRTTTGSAYCDYDKWDTDNALAYSLCQGVGTVPSSSVTGADKRNPQYFAGSYLSEEDISESKIADSGTQILDYWGRPLAYCGTIAKFWEDKKSGYLNPNSKNTSWATASTLQTLTVNSNTNGQSVNYVCYKTGRQYYSRSRKFMGPVSYALKGTWSDAEVNMPEIWSIGDDGEYAKLQYNKSNSSFHIKVGDVYPDADNVGGNVNVMKIQK